MRVVPNRVHEFDEICAEYASVDDQGRDIVALVKMFGDKNEHFSKGVQDSDYSNSWHQLLSEHSHQLTPPMVGQILYLLLTYWEHGQRLLENLPPLEKILLRDTVQQISDEIDRRSAANATLP